MKAKLCTGRYWAHPAVYAIATSEKIELQVNLFDDGIDAVIEEIGNPTLLVTKAQLKKKMKAAFEKVLSEVRRASVEV